ncbi:MAG: ATP-binding protein, partial [Desulfobacterales bacterium]
QRMFYESTFPVMLHAEDGEVLVINRAWREISGFRHDEIPTISDWTEKAYGRQKNEIKARIEKLYELNRRRDEGEFVIQTKDRQQRTWRFHAIPLDRLPDGRRMVMSQANDVTEQKRAKIYREHYIQELQLVSDTIIQGSRVTDIDALCQLLGETIHGVNPRAYVLVSLYDRKEKAIKLKTMHGFGEFRETAKDYLGMDPMDFNFRPEERGEEFSLFTTGLIEEVPGGLYQLLAQKIPSAACREMETLLDIGSVYTIGFALDDRPYGGLSLLLKKGEDLRFRYAIETLVSHFSVIINRQQTEEDRTQLEYALRQAQKLEAIGTLAGGIAHDFNNILSSILGYSELLLEDAEKGTLLEQNLSQIYAAGARAKDLVKQILTFSRQTESEVVPLNVKLLVKESMKLLWASLPKSIEIKQEIETDTLVSGDPAQIHQIVMNLCTNAAQAMDKNGVMTVGLKGVELDEAFVASHSGVEPGKYVALSVSDTGPGIDPEIIGKIFDPFFTTKSEEQGTGLGLSVVHGIVESHHGLIHVESQPGQGSEFIVYLPAAEFAPTQTEASTHELPKGSEKILFVDDEHSIAEMVGQQLTGLGYAVEVRTSSADALERFRQSPGDFDLLITDMAMPEMTGVDLIEEVRRVRPDMPAILCTGFSEQINEEMAEEMGISTFLLKPIIREEMAAAIRRAFDA